jgi:hypothetical protein
MTLKNLYKLLYYQKFMGIGFILLGIPIAIFSKSTESTTMLIVGLFVLFTSWEKIMDERLMSLKTTSIYLAIVLSYTFKYVSSELVKQQLTSYEMTNINHFILLVFASANLIYFGRLLLDSSRGND